MSDDLPTQPVPASADAPLIARLRAGDDDAFEELVRDHTPNLLAVARRFLHNEADACDAVQEAFLAAFRSLHRFEGNARLSTWLHRIVVNAALMKLRSDRRHPARSIEELLPAFREDGHQRNPARPWKPGAADGIPDSEIREVVRSAIGQLPEPFLTVLLLRDIEGLNTEQTAEQLGVSPSAVKTRLHRARQALRELLDPYFREAAS